MHASEFARQRARIERRAGNHAAFLRKAMAHLLTEADAVEIVIRGQVVGWQMSDGGVVCVKRRFRDEVAASLALVAIGREDLRKSTPVRCYRCDYCGGWHLTSRARGADATNNRAG